jgi:predicted esterase
MRCIGMKFPPRTRPRTANHHIGIGLPAVTAIATALLLAAGGAGCRPAPTPALLLEETSMEDFAIEDFDAVHSPLGGEANKHLIFGALSIPPPAAGLAPDWAALLGRWEGYSYAPPVAQDMKFVFFIQGISAEGGSALLWAGTNLQYPKWIKEIQFRTGPGNPPSIEWESSEGGKQSTYSFSYDPDTDQLEGWKKSDPLESTWEPIRLNRERSFSVYEDYPAYLAGKRIYPVKYKDDLLTRYYGDGFLLYLPDGYEADPNQVWPLILFLHGTGDRGDNVFLLAKASPLMMIRETGPLACLIVAPLLGTSGYYYSFPESYLDGVLEQVLADYRVDRARIYGTGVSVGGEAVYRYAVHRPDFFAAIASVSGYLESASGLERLAGLPIRVIHGADDPVIPLAKAQQDVETLKRAGADVSFIVLENHDHDAWTDTYSDPDFYAWLLEHARP